MSEKKHEEPAGESAPLWIISFCDLALCMLSFFVILSASAGTKNINYDPEFNELVAAIKKAFKYLPPAPANQAGDLKSILNALKVQKGKSGSSGKPGEAAQRMDGLAGKHDMVTTVRTGSQTTIGGSISFTADSAKLLPDDEPSVRQIADKIRGHMNVFMVKGHTSRDEEYRLQNTGRDLAYDRANTVLRKLVELGVAREGLRLESCRDFEPVREGAYSEVTRAANRRVEVVATEALVSEYRGQKPANSPSSTKLLELRKKVESKVNEQKVEEPPKKTEP
jgi:flagellar motor protein MotB